MSVWRYGLYDTVTGARIDRNSGFPIDYTNGSQTWHGYLGYYGLQLPNDALVTLQNGSTVQKVEYGTGGQAPTITPLHRGQGRRSPAQVHAPHPLAGADGRRCASTRTWAT